MRFSFALAVGAALITALPLAAQTAPVAPSGQSNATAHREPLRPKNLQVLPKDISAKDLIQTMRGYTQALGVECSFCHADNPQTHRRDFASDANPHKNTARIMIRMVNEIDTKYLATADPDASPNEKKVSCGTCHRGHSHPPAFVPTNEREHSKS